MGLPKTLGWLLVLTLSAVALTRSSPPANADATAAAPKKAGPDWWSLQLPRDIAPPEVKDASWAVNPIDRFVLAKLDATGLRPSPAADSRALIRRVTFDLTGLPPAPEEVEAFFADASPDAYAKLVDRLLASPAYGQRWARHWLDVVRFGESQGFERDQLRPNAWRYRDWVIDALNADMPYDQFVRLQLAGDAMAPDDASSVIATGFLVCGPYDEVGETIGSKSMQAVTRADSLEDLVGVTAQTFLGLTANCARCHDHLFDPIPQAEYFSLVSALSGVRHGERSVSPGGPAAQRELVQAEARLTDIRSQLAAIEEPARQRALAAKGATPPPNPPQPLARWTFDTNFADRVGGLHGDGHGAATVSDGRVVLDGRTAFVTTLPIKKALTEKTLEAWVSLTNPKQSGGGVISIEAKDGSTFDAIVFGEREPGVWMAGSEGFARYESVGGAPETKAIDRLHVAITYAADGTIAVFRDGRPYGRPYKSRGVQTFGAGAAHVLFGIRHNPVGGNRMFEGAIHQAHLYDRALSADEIARSAGAFTPVVSPGELVAAMSAEDRARHAALASELASLESRRQQLAPGKTYAAVPQQPEPTRIQLRGNPAAPGDVVAPGAITSLVSLSADFKLPPDAPEAQRRLKLAEWIASRDNPLTARVMANRLWHHHFGAGIVDTPNDFGFNGARPTHPELLDWLALELMRTGWSLKSLHRTIVTSATYCQSSQPNPAGLAKDADGRLLWRKNPLRLTAEDVRDSILHVAGRLNPTAGGPGYHEFKVREHNATFYDPFDGVGPEYDRRSIYRTWARSGTNRFLDVFDCPDPSTTTPKRVLTTTPLQALALMNNAFVLRMSDALAARVHAEAGEGVGAQIDRVYKLAYGRAADAEELAAGESFVREHGLAGLGRVVFNSNEFVYVD